MLDHQIKNAVIARKPQTRTRVLILFFSCVLWFSVLYSFNSGGGNKGFTLFATYANSIASSRGPKSQNNSSSNGGTITGKIDTDPCSGRYIYLHNLPPEFNERILSNCGALIKWFDMCPYTTNLGFGPKLEDSGGGGWFSTNQFFLEVIFHNRMKHYECLTNDSSAASAVFVPFYAGLDAGRYIWDLNTSVRDSTSLRLSRWLARRPEWKRMQGRDHFLITGRISWDFQRPSESNQSQPGWGNRLLLLPETKNMTVLGIESSFGYRENEFSIPYPTYFHPSSDNEVFRWQEMLRRPRRRPYLFSFAGGARADMTHSMRSEIMEQCRGDSKTKCKLMDCDPSGENKCDDPISVIELFVNSTFCLQPRGDSYTRRSIFDSILAGCIPVFFNRGSAYLQYTWHLPKNHSKYSVFIPETDVNDRKVRIEKRLMGFSEEEVLAMRKEVIRLIPRVVYADPLSTLETLEDAFDIAVKGVLDRVEKLKRG